MTGNLNFLFSCMVIHENYPVNHIFRVNNVQALTVHGNTVEKISSAPFNFHTISENSPAYRSYKKWGQPVFTGQPHAGSGYLL